MNPDDFEKQLQRQALQSPPAAWREEILTAARANVPTTVSGRERELLTGWRVFLARIPIAWGAVAALWLIIIGVNSLMSGPSGTVSSGSRGRAMMTAWSAQRIQASLLASGSADLSEITPPRETHTAPPPRSDRRRDDGLGNFDQPARRLTSV